MKSNIRYLPTVSVDAVGFIYVNGFKTPVKLDANRKELEFYDRNKNRSWTRGTPFVRVGLEHFAQALTSIIESRGHNYEQED